MYDVFSVLFVILFLEWNEKNEKAFNILFLLVAFCFKIMGRN